MHFAAIKLNVKIQRETKKILDVDFILDPELFILGFTPENMTDKRSIKLVRTLHLAKAAALMHGSMESEGKKCLYYGKDHSKITVGNG